MPPRRSTHRSLARFLGRVVEGAEAGPSPGFVQPCRPTERSEPPSSEVWLHEIKHDGYRVQAHVREGAPRLYTINGYDWTARMPALAASVRALPVNNVVLDGELVAVDAKGLPSFFDLPSAVGAPTRVKGRLVYYAFDMLYLDGVRSARRGTDRPQARARSLAREYAPRAARQIRRAPRG